MNKNSTPLHSGNVFTKFKQILVNTFSAPDFENFRQTTGNQALDKILLAADSSYQGKMNDLAQYIQSAFQATQVSIFLLENTENEDQFLILKAYHHTERKEYQQELAIGRKFIQNAYFKKRNLILGNIPPDYSSSIQVDKIPFYIHTTPLAIYGKVIGIIEIASLKKLTEEQIYQLKEISTHSAEYIIDLKAA